MMDPAVALRVLANSVGGKWYTMLKQDCSGLGHIHDLWNEMYKDMGAIVCLEQYITNNTGGECGVDFGKVPGFESEVSMRD